MSNGGCRVGGLGVDGSGIAVESRLNVCPDCFGVHVESWGAKIEYTCG